MHDTGSGKHAEKKNVPSQAKTLTGFEPGRAIAPIPQGNLKCPVKK